MKILNQSTIQDLQRSFSAQFPGLKIEFYSAKHGDHEGSSKKEQLRNNMLLKDLNLSKEIEDWEIKPSSQVSEFEQAMETEFGLHVQVFRRSNELWLQTSVTDDWTLEKQNLKGLHSTQSAS